MKKKSLSSNFSNEYDDKYFVCFCNRSNKNKVIVANGYDKAIEIAEKVKELIPGRGSVRIIRNCKIYEYY